MPQTSYGQVNCTNDCDNSILFGLFKINKIRKKHVKDVKNKKEKVWQRIENLMSEKELFNHKKHSLGCFFFYTAYATIASEIDEDSTFYTYLIEDMYYNPDEILQIKKKGKIAAEYALDIWKNRNNCNDKWDKVKSYPWERFLNNILNKFNSLPYKGDLLIKDFFALPNKIEFADTTTFSFYVENNSKQDINKPITLTLTPYKGAEDRKYYIHNLKANEDTLFVIDYCYPKTGNHESAIEIKTDSFLHDITPLNNKSEVSVIVLEDRPPTPPEDTLSETMTVQTNNKSNDVIITGDFENGEFNYTLKTFGGTGTGCLIYHQQFDIGDTDTELSEKIDKRLIENCLKPFLRLNKLHIDNATITLKGYADSIPFSEKGGSELPGDLTEIHGGGFFNLGTKKNDGLNSFNKITNNERLAYARAYYVMLKMMKAFKSLDEDNFDLQIKVDKENTGKKWRGATLKMCWENVNSVSLTKLHKVLKEVIEGGRSFEDVYTISPNTTVVNKRSKGDESNYIITIDDQRELRDIEVWEGQVIEMREIKFEANSAKIQTQWKTTFREIRGLIARNPEFRYEIAGHTSVLCSDCKELSRQRAKAVYDRLISMGVSRKLMKYKGYGKTEPKSTPGQSTNERKMNQRVEIRVFKKSE